MLVLIMALAAAAIPEQRAFDFWVGEWDVYDTAGVVVGHSRVESILKGAVLLENWKSVKGNEGKSFNRYNPLSKQWEQHWVDDEGGEVFFKGQLDGKVMRFTSDSKDKDGHSLVTRMTFTPLPNGQVRQLWEQSLGDGKFKVTFDGYYRRRTP